MKIASNKLSDLYAFYKRELNNLYDEDELYAIFELVCQKYLGFSKQDVKLKFEENVNQSDLLKIYDAALELKKEIPIQYILKEAFFYDSMFYVTPSVLIPRPETEELVDLVLKSQATNNSSQPTILDIGTGSGCIPITLKKHLPNAKVFGIDISTEALEVAKSNAVKHDAEVEFIKLDVLSSFNISHSTFSIIISNPPYVLLSEAKEMDARVLKHEPHVALFVENDNPIIFYIRIIDLCKEHLEEKGHLFFELNPLYANEVKKYAEESQLFKKIEVLKDMSGKLRFLKAQKN